MKISKIFAGYKFKIEGKDYEIESLCYNSKECTKNSLFFAIIGEQRDGHEFIDDAIKNGATAVVIQKDVKLKKSEITKIIVSDTKDALAYACKNFYNNPSEKLTLIGITGTNGKTTITYLLEKIFDNSSVIGTINYRIKNKIFKSENTTPLALELNKFLQMCIQNSVKYTIMEVSSHGIELNRVKYLNFDCGVFTNLSHEHLDFHKSIENYFNAKKKFFTNILYNSSKRDKFAVVNIDDEYGKKIFDEIKNNIKTISYSISNKSDVFAESYDITLSGINAKIITPNGKISIKSNLIGEFNLYNLLAAIAVAVGFNVDIKFIEKKLNKEIIIPGRLERVVKNKNYFVDYAHTPDALENVLKTLNKIKGKRRIITVFGCGGDRDRLKRPIMGYTAAKYSDFVVVTSDNPRNEDPFKIIDDILEGIKKAVKEGFLTDDKYRIIPDRKDAILMGIKAAKNGDILLVAGKGHEDYQIIGNKKIEFSDKKVILDGLKQSK